jgi:PAS domain S-box-containing protein
MEQRRPGGHQRSSVRTLAKAAWVGYGCAIVVVACFMLWAASQTRNIQLSEARQTTQNLARVIEQNTVRSFEAVLLLLRLAEFRLTQIPTDSAGMPPWDPARFRSEIFGRVGFISTIEAVDTGTQQVVFRLDQADSQAPTRLSASELVEALEAIAQNPSGVAIGRPVRSTDGYWVLPVSRKVGRPLSGQSDDVVLTAYVSLSHLQSFYDRIDIGNGSIALLKDDFSLIVRRPRLDASVGAIIATGRAAERLTRPGVQTAEGRSGADGVVRIASIKRLDGWPLIVAATLDKAEVLAPIDSAIARNFMIAALFAAISGLALHRLIRVVNQRAQSEDRSFRQAEIFRSILDHMAQGLMMARPDGKMAVYNQRAIELLGLPRELLDARPTSDQVLAWQTANGEFAPADANTLRRLNPFDGKGPTVYQRMRPNGVWLEIMTVPLPTGGVIRTYTDISKRKAAELALEQSEERYRILTETTSDTITRLNLDFKREYVSPNCAKIFGFTPDEMLGGQPSASIHPEDADSVRAFAAELVAGKVQDDRGTVTYRTRHKAGHWVWVEAAMTLARDPSSGRAVAIVCSLRDTTDRRLAEEALQESEARFRLLADNATDVVVRIDLNFRRRYVSPSSREILGYSPEELLEAPLAHLVHPHDEPALRQCLSSLREGAVEQGKSLYRCKRKDGNWMWMETHLRLIRDSAGQPFEILASGRDVTERHLHAEELRAAKDKAEAGSKAKSDFVATISHEIRTPLNAVIGFSGLLLERDNLPSDVVQQLNVVHDAGNALLNVVNDVLDFSRIEAGKLVVDEHAFGIRPLLEGCMAILQPAASAKDLRLELEVSQVVPQELQGDDGLVRQVLLNLMNNAVKFTSHGHVRVVVDHMDGETLFSVEDSGRGIPSDKHDRLFKEFSQVEAAHSRTFGGTGLGLVICKRIVERLGGCIGFESLPGIGSRFWFRLPLVAATVAGLEETERGDERTALPLRILVVDDMAVNRELAAAILRSAGHQVDLASDGNMAIDCAMQSAYDVILMDVQMPIMDGMEAAERIRKSTGPSAIAPIVALTANAYAEQVAAYVRAGMEHHIPKPFTPQTLRTLVGQIAAASQSRPAAGPTTWDASTLDPATVRGLMSSVGSDRAIALYKMFLADIDRPLPADADADGLQELASVAHQLAGSAGLLGLSELERCARTLMDLALAGAHVSDERAAFDEARTKAVAAVSELIATRAAA